MGPPNLEGPPIFKGPPILGRPLKSHWSRVAATAKLYTLCPLLQVICFRFSLLGPLCDIFGHSNRHLIGLVRRGLFCLNLSASMT